MIKNVKMKIPKALARDAGVWLPKNVGAMEQIGKMAILMIKKRIREKGVDGMGKSIGSLKSFPIWFYTAPGDPRFTGHVKKIGGRGGVPALLVHHGGYKSLKRSMGGKPKADGHLTGAMWDGLQPKLKRVRGGWQILLRFFGTQVTAAKPTGQHKIVKKKKRRKGRVVAVKVTRVPIIKKEKTSNKVKAAAFQKSHRVALLSLTATERQYLMDMYLRLVKQQQPFK